MAHWEGAQVRKRWPK